jgi:beta-galactosidase
LRHEPRETAMWVSLRMVAILGFLGLSSWTVPTTPAATSSAPVNLAGVWRFALDRADTGVKERWFARDLQDRIALPGILQSQGYGDDISTTTPWVHGLHDHYWFLREDYRAYAHPGQAGDHSPAQAVKKRDQSRDR